eukprot:3423515-Pleurochrysis_carterae.AAC.2
MPPLNFFACRTRPQPGCSLLASMPSNQNFELKENSFAAAAVGLRPAPFFTITSCSMDADCNASDVGYDCGD